MAIVINPDGTVSTMEIEYDSAGNIKPKVKADMIEPPYISKVASHFPNSKEFDRKKKKVSYTLGDEGNSSEINYVVAKRKPRITKYSIDQYFKRRKESHQLAPVGIFSYAEAKLNDELFAYFKHRFIEHNSYCKEMGWVGESSTPKNATSKKKEKKKKKPSKTNFPKQDGHSKTSGNTIADIASFSSLHKSASDDVVFGRSMLETSRKPKYGYARDRFGRIQERDKFDENRHNEFRQAQKRQSGYDYSNYDENDDHDSYYDKGGYE